ncbi:MULTISPECIES: GntR family transcriptional regulator [Nocardia]|uniref:GntR family transcriptional regulator n=1 Tax=Nocardia vulneris TaxID=1141657 RepID=A0ABR4ZEU0_9NOCA|nr:MULTISPECIES: GntR family transcriptional regulator [Nocardia]ASF08448.1 GntR family transcriptional regulator [Nocardia brasiliensis]KIA63897.1 GntR family transcriptional regulator [Nocardia vulneris]GAJ85705.1 putative GntR family transcriptional regulator [Nocardia brasiliensis NBRC 14402]SUB41072.1 HTH-type transcriptional regulator mcbR [Nocardia brasiliensis]
MIERLDTRKRPTLRDHVSDALRAAIISGELEPGVLYSAPWLSERFGVSATPVREAMLDLVKQGLVISVPNKGFRVTEASDEDLDAIAEIRLLLEPPSVRAIVDRIPQADMPGLRAAADKIVDAAKRGDLVEYVDADRRFHLMLLAYCRNPRLSQIVSDLRAQTRLLGLAALVARGELDNSAQEHHTILDLIEQRQDAQVESFLRNHIGHVRGLWAPGNAPDKDVS